MDINIEKDCSGTVIGGRGYGEVEPRNGTAVNGMLNNQHKNTETEERVRPLLHSQMNINPQLESAWYKCKECEQILRGRVQFLIHQSGHQRTGPQLFHTQNGSIMEIHKLPNSFEIFTPKIGLKTIEEICDTSKLKIKQVSVDVTKLTDAEIKSAIEASLKRKLRVRKSKGKQNTFEDQEECVFQNDDKASSDSDWSGQSEMDIDVPENTEKKTGKRRKSKKLIRTVRRIFTQYTCSLCPLPVTYRNYDSYCRHIKQWHLKNETFNCTKCEHTNTKTSLPDFILHMNTHKSPSEKQFTCLLCPDQPTFSTSVIKSKHMNTTHLVDGRYKCPYCPLIKLTKSSRLEKHLLLHETSGVKRNIYFVPMSFGKQAQRQKAQKQSYNCTIANCRSSFWYESEFRKHLKAHERQEQKNAAKPYRCEHCSVGFTNVVNLKRHSNKHLENNPYVCKFPDCGQRLISKYGLEKHMYLHFVKPMECPICHHQFSQRRGLDRHMIKFHSKGGVTTLRKRRIAGTRVKRLREMAEVRIPDDLAKAYSVPAVPAKESANGSNSESCVMKLESDFECKSEQPQDHEGRVELRNVNLEDSDTFAAQTAAVSASLKREGVKMTEAQSSRNNVSETVQEVPEFVVRPGEAVQQQYPARIRRAALRNDPLLAQMPEDFVNAVKATCEGGDTTGGELGAYPCKLCPASYQRLYFYRRHMLSVHPEEAAQEFTETEKKLTTGVGLTCAACGFQSESSKALAAHMEEHFQDRKFHCSFCGIKLLTQIRLDKHVKTIHLSERKFKCNSCPKRFATKSHLREHQTKVHSSPVDPKELICKYCGKQTSYLWSLKIHLKLHEEGRERRVCKICNEKLSCTTALRVHIQRVHFKQMLISTSAKTINSTANNDDKNIEESEDLFL